MAADRDRWRALVERTMAEAERTSDPYRQRTLRELAQDYIMRSALGVPFPPEHANR